MDIRIIEDTIGNSSNLADERDITIVYDDEPWVNFEQGFMQSKRIGSASKRLDDDGLIDKNVQPILQLIEVSASIICFYCSLVRVLWTWKRDFAKFHENRILL